jgi:hypothetical protein
MSDSRFILAMKSTLDYEAKLIADSRGLPFIDLDAENFETELLESDEFAVCWQFASATEDPMDPLYVVLFDVGVMGMLDPAQYISLEHLSIFLDHFKSGMTFQIKDYSGTEMPVEVLGTLFVTGSAITPQQSDRATGIRFVTVTARASRHV